MVSDMVKIRFYQSYSQKGFLLVSYRCLKSIKDIKLYHIKAIILKINFCNPAFSV